MSEPSPAAEAPPPSSKKHWGCLFIVMLLIGALTFRKLQKTFIFYV